MAEAKSSSCSCVEGTSSYTNRWGVAYEFTGLASGAAADVSKTGDGYAAGLTSGSTAVATQARELVFAAFDVQAAASGFVPGVGFQALTPAPGDVIGQVLVPEFAVVSTIGARQASASYPSPVSYVGAVVAYRAGP